MENEFVNIDQVFQERMALHEEPMTRGAWNKMHQRLEEAMPQKKRPLFFIKRFFALIILLSLSLVGARKVVDFNSSKGNIARSKAVVPFTQAVVVNNKQQSHSEAAIAIPTSNAQSNGVADITNNAPTENKAIDNSEPSETSSSITTATTHSTNHHSSTINHNKNETKTAVHEKTTTPKITEVPVEELDAPQSIASSTANTQGVTKNNNAFAKKSIQASSTFISSKLINKNIPIYAYADYNKNNADTLSYVIKRDTIKKIYIKQRYAINAFSGKKELITDSFIEKATIDRKVYASQINSLALGKPTYKEAEHTIVELSSKRIATKASSWNPSNFMNWMTQAKINLSNTQPNYAFLFGINGANNGSNTFAGFHLGVSGQISLGTNCLASAEFRYVMKMNSGFAFQFMSRQVTCNDSVAFQTGSPALTMMSYNKLIDSSNKVYNFNAMHTIEVPFSIQYNYKRWSALLGMSVAYNFKLKTSEINYSAVKSQRDTLLPGSFAPSSVNTIIPVSDFASKLNINYLIGLQYHISPMIYLDARMVKAISTSASSNGEKQVYDQVYKMPTFELSLGYFFRKKN